MAIATVMAISIVAVSSGQSGPPDIRGLYAGTNTYALFNCNDFDFNATDTFPGMLYCFDQQGADFRFAFVDEEGNSSGFNCSGTVTATGAISGEYSFKFEFEGGQSLRSGTVTGQINVATGAITVNLVGKISVEIPDNDIIFVSCQETLSFSGSFVRSTTSSDVSITSTAAPDPVASGTRLTYTMTINNAGPDAATGVSVAGSIPEGATFSSLSTSQGTFTTPAIGSTGAVNLLLGTIPPNGSAKASMTVNVLAPSGQTLANTVSVASVSTDPKPANNTVTTNTRIQGGATVRLIWDQPTPTAANPTPAPTNLRVVPGGLNAASLPESETIALGPAEGPCTLLRVNVHKSEVPGFLPTMDNLWRSVPPDQLQTTMAAAPAGSFFVITNVWQCGDNKPVDSAGSNQASVPAGPTLNRVKVGAKIKVIGSGFTDPAQVFLDGIAFARPAVFGDSTLVQKGTLSDGRSIGDVVRPGRTVVISVRLSNGGISSIAFTLQ